ncbi:Galactan beta-1,4-galactosyltransferase GALS1 [Hordeum vulgare]|nr:Galactan beta-1,4-galactosyltransferase GALS1 [Hordeum vulgare]
MREWMAYHAHFFGPRSHFVFHDAGGVSPEFLVVNDCLHWYRHAANWTFFFDVDEYLYLPDGQALDQVLAKLSGYTQFTFEQNPMSTKLCIKNPRNGYSREWGFEKFVFRNSITRVRRDRKYAIQARNAYATGVHMSQNVYGRSTHKTETLIRDLAYEYAFVRTCWSCRLVVQVLVKKMFRVSHMAREFASRPVDTDACTCCVEVPHVGALQKLLLPLQVGYDGVTKDRDSEGYLDNMNRALTSADNVKSNLSSSSGLTRQPHQCQPPPPFAGVPDRRLRQLARRRGLVVANQRRTPSATAATPLWAVAPSGGRLLLLLLPPPASVGRRSSWLLLAAAPGRWLAG